MFEAGALSKSLSAARVCPLLFGIDASDVKGPLVQFQAAPFTKDEMKKAVRMMNQELGAAALASDVLDSVFEMWWPKLEEKIVKVVSADRRSPKQTVRSERDMIEEILARVRAAPSISSRETTIHPEAIADLLDGYERLVFEVTHLSPDARGNLLETIERLRRPVEYIVRRTGTDEELSSLARMERVERLERQLRRAIVEEEPRRELIEEGVEKPKPNKRVHRRR
jgi:hypothetical protein